MSIQYPEAKEKLIEQAANGFAAINTLSESIPGLIPVPPKGSKEARLISVSGYVEAGNVWIPTKETASWSEGFIDEVVNFPNGDNDDQVDGMSMALHRLGREVFNFDLVIPSGGVRSNPWSFANA